MHAELQTLHVTVAPFGNARRRWGIRSSVRLHLSDGRGGVSVGEAAPLPGFSRETTREAREALTCVDWPGEVPTSLAEIARVVARIDARVPSARFAAETALTSLFAKRLGMPLWAAYADRVGEIPLASALLGADDEALLESARDAAAYEVPAVKVKVGRDLEVDLRLLEFVRELLPHAELRLDANGTFDPSELGDRLAAMAAFDPAFVEEPCELDAMLALSETPIPFAVDESLAGSDGDDTLDRALACSHVDAIVLKPSLLGGLARCLEMARRARSAGRRVIVSHLMEGAIARAASAHLALAIGGDAAGLGRHPALDALSDGLDAPWIDLAWIEPPQLPGLGLELAF